MGRAQNQGLVYFPLDVSTDEKIEMIEARHGIVGFGVVIKLFQHIYRKGYYCKWGEKEQLLFSRRINVEINVITDVINVCIDEDIVNIDAFNAYSILTSVGIQKRFFEVAKRRKYVEIVKEYLLIEPEIDDVNIKWISVNTDSINVNTHVVNVNTGTQSKGEYSKLEENKEEEIPLQEKAENSEEKNSGVPGYRNFTDLLTEQHGIATGEEYFYTKTDGKMIKDLLKKLGEKKALEKLRQYYQYDYWFVKGGRSVKGFIGHINEIGSAPLTDDQKELKRIHDGRIETKKMLAEDEKKKAEAESCIKF